MILGVVRFMVSLLIVDSGMVIYILMSGCVRLVCVVWVLDVGVEWSVVGIV